MVVEELKQVKQAEREVAASIDRARAEAADRLKKARLEAEAGRREAKRKGAEEGDIEAEAILARARSEALAIAGRAEAELQRMKESAGRRQEQAVIRLLGRMGIG